MSKRFILFVGVFVLALTTAKSQTTYYYKLTKKVHNRIPSTNVSGGQFITFSGDICFESTKGGVGVGHGKLTYNSNYSNEQIKVYTGKSYWGDKTTFRFSKDLTTLNVSTRGREVYVYKRTNAPHGVTTCSLIRESSSGRGGSSGSGGSGGGSYPVQPIYPAGGGNNPVVGANGGMASGSSSSQGNTQQRERVWRNCSHCHGKGTVVRDSYVATFGNDSKMYCAQCGQSYWSSTGHSHVTCPICRGNRGRWSE